MESRPRRALPAHIPVLDGLRGLLTLLVLVHHIVGAVVYTVLPRDAARWTSEVRFAQGTAVTLPIYFVISGFVIFLPAARGNGRLGELSWYALRRVTRIVPAYYLNLGILLLVWPFLFSDAPSPMATRRGIELVLGHLTFLQSMLFNRTDVGFGLNGSVWTLTLEEFFYFTIPFAAPLFFRHPLRTLAASLSLALAWRTASFYLPEVTDRLGLPAPDALLPSHLFHQFPGYWFQFALGAAAARLFVQHWDSPFVVKYRSLLGWVHVLCLFAIGGLLWRVGHIDRLERQIVPDITHDMVPAFFFAVMVLALALGPEGPQRLYDNRVCRFLGDTSYGVYLWHMVLIQIVYRYGGLPRPASDRSLFIYAVWVVPGALFLGFLSFRLVERPFSVWVRRTRSELKRARAGSGAPGG